MWWINCTEGRGTREGALSLVYNNSHCKLFLCHISYHRHVFKPSQIPRPVSLWALTQAPVGGRKADLVPATTIIIFHSISSSKKFLKRCFPSEFPKNRIAVTLARRRKYFIPDLLRPNHLYLYEASCLLFIEEPICQFVLWHFSIIFLKCFLEVNMKQGWVVNRSAGPSLRCRTFRRWRGSRSQD